MDVETLALTRRKLLVAGAAGGLAVVLPDAIRTADAAPRRRVPLAREGTFRSGVLSGDPGPDAITLWTRLDGQEAARQRVRLEVSRDPDFRRTVLKRDVPITRLRDHTAKVRVTGLEPDERYFYRFSTRTSGSEVGRAQTAPAPGSKRTLRIGYFACQDFSSGYYGAYRALLDKDPDVVICGGDYMYERVFAEDGYGKARKDEAGDDGVARDIDGYREKYRLYRSDPDLHELHRLVPIIAQWDDHEVSDNYVGTLDRNPFEEKPEDQWNRDRILSGWRAWHEYFPALRFGKGYRTFRDLRFGDLAHLYVLDSRTHRDKQPCEDASLSPCDESGVPRAYLGREQLDWLKRGLTTSPANWKLVLNQLMIMPYDVVQGTLPVTQDSWEGYQAERTELLSAVERGAKDVVFVTGDIHTFFAGRVLRDGRSGPAVATELVGGSTTSPGTAELIANRSGGAVPADLAQNLTDPGVRTQNPWLDYAQTRGHGCMLLEVTPEAVTTEVLVSRDILTAAGSRDVRVDARLTTRRGRPGVQVG